MKTVKELTEEVFYSEFRGIPTLTGNFRPKLINFINKDILDQLHKQVEGLPFARMDLGKNWDAGEWISRKDVLTLIKERME